MRRELILPSEPQTPALVLGPVPRRRRTRPYVLLGVALLLALFGGVGVWAATARLDGAVIAAATFTVESKRKTVQHLEGGIVEEILVRDGDRVERGQLLLRLDNTIHEANFAIVEDELRELEARRTRLLAELRGDDALRFPGEPGKTAEDPRLQAIRAGQRALFQVRRKSRAGEDALRRQRIESYRQEIDWLVAQRAANERQVALIRDELTGLKRLHKKGLAPRRRLLALQREAERIQGTTAALNARMARAENTIHELRMQKVQSERQLHEEVSTELRGVEPRLTVLRERRIAARRKRSLAEVRAPAAGVVVGMQAHTPGGVIRAGEPILDIVPAGDALVLEARVPTRDIDKIIVGQAARVRLTAFDQATTPEAVGDLVSVSADSLRDEKTGHRFYVARVHLAASQPEGLDGLAFVPGMPAEVLIQTGARTPVSYFLQPLTDRLARSFKDG